MVHASETTYRSSYELYYKDVKSCLFKSKLKYVLNWCWLYSGIEYFRSVEMDTHRTSKLKSFTSTYSLEIRKKLNQIHLSFIRRTYTSNLNWIRYCTFKSASPALKHIALNIKLKIETISFHKKYRKKFTRIYAELNGTICMNRWCARLNMAFEWARRVSVLYG